MAFRRRAVLLVVVCGMVAAAPVSLCLPEAAERAVDASAAEFQTYVERPASDEFRGRGVGDAGNRAAEEFIRPTVTRAGLRPAGADRSCYEPVDVYGRALRAGRTLRAALTPDLVVSTIRIHNVLGLVEGRDGHRRDELVVVGTHLDHDGVDDEDWRFSGLPKIDASSSVNTLHVLGYSLTPARSDQWPFLRRGIPAVFLTTGLHPDYHTRDDDAERIDFGKLERVAKLGARTAWIVAEGQPPRMAADRKAADRLRSTPRIKATDKHG